jgi:hypothetical protein
MTSVSLAGADGSTRVSTLASPLGAGRCPLGAVDVSAVAPEPAASWVSAVPESELVLEKPEAVLAVSPPLVRSLPCLEVVDEVVALPLAAEGEVGVGPFGSFGDEAVVHARTRASNHAVNRIPAICFVLVTAFVTGFVTGCH